MHNKIQRQNVIRPPGPLRIGFVPLTDCAPLVMAKELGLFSKYGLRVELRRELGWATIRDKVIYRDLEAAHAVAGMPFAATLGLGSPACDCLTALVMNQHGNAITVSNDLWKRGVRDAASLRKEITKRGPQQLLTFGVVYPYSSHNFILRAWLNSAAINPDTDARIVVVPPPQMVVNLKAGHLDGFCVGEPWNSVAVQSAGGHCLATSAELAPGHPEKVLMTRRDFAEKNPSQHLALVAATLEACAFCQQPDNQAEVIATLARSEYLGVPEQVLARGIKGELDLGRAEAGQSKDFNVFYSPDANEPSSEKAGWLLRHLRQSGRIPDPTRLTPVLGGRVFRSDLYLEATRLTPNRQEKAIQPHEDSSQTKLISA